MKRSPRNRSRVSGSWALTRIASTSTAVRSRSDIPSEAAARAWWPRSSGRWSTATPNTAWRRCASGWGRASRRSGSECESLSERDPAAVRSMFDRIARRYDRVNTVLSLGTDSGWRRRAARETGLRPGGSAVDVACGSGKLTAELAKIAGPAGRVVGVDFSPQMLEVARRAHPGLEFLEGDALNLQFDDASFDAYRTPEELTGMAARAGWSDVLYRGLAMGTAGVLSGTQ